MGRLKHAILSVADEQLCLDHVLRHCVGEDEELSVPPEALVESIQVKPDPLPPAANNCSVLRGETGPEGGVMDTPAVTLAAAVAMLPNESVHWTTSLVEPLLPAVYRLLGAKIGKGAHLAADSLGKLFGRTYEVSLGEELGSHHANLRG